MQTQIADIEKEVIDRCQDDAAIQLGVALHRLGKELITIAGQVCDHPQLRIMEHEVGLRNVVVDYLLDLDWVEGIIDRHIAGACQREGYCRLDRVSIEQEVRANLRESLKRWFQKC